MNFTNLRAKALRLYHADLKRSSPNSPYKSECPVCPNGVLAICRSPGTWRLSRVDRCSGCGQLIIYLDEAVNTERFPTEIPDTENGILC